MTWLAESLRLLLAQLKEIMKVLKEIRDLMKEGHMDKKPRLIDADSLLEFAHNHIGGMIDCNDIARFPAVEAEPVRHGRWRTVNVPKKWGGATLRCSECNTGGTKAWTYCPNCGAKMDGGNENEG